MVLAEFLGLFLSETLVPYAEWAVLFLAGTAVFSSVYGLIKSLFEKK